jgi:hypothetical protein
MKPALLITLFAFASAVGALQAAKDDKKLPDVPKTDGTELPGGGKRWGVFSMEDAKKEAAKKKQPMAFVVLDERAEELAQKEANKTAFWGLEKECTMVVLPSGTKGQWKDRLPAAAYAGVTDKALGKEMPQVVVLDQTVATVIGTMGANAIIDGKEEKVKEFTKLMKETNKDPAKIAAAAAAKPAAPAAEPAKPAAPGPASPGATPAATAPAVVSGPVAIKEPKADNWTNAQGTAIQAAVTEITDDKVTFRMANGAMVPYDIANLSDESKKRLVELKAANAGK